MDQNAQLYSTVIPIVIIALIMVRRLSRMNKVRPLKLERLWIVPTLYLVMALLVFFATPMRPAPADWLWIAIALALGGAVGWFRGKTIQISVDPATHALNQKPSVLGMLLFLGILGVRYLLRAEAGVLGINLLLVTDCSLAFVVGMFSLLRVEMFIRARRLLDQVRGAGPLAPPPADAA